MVWFKKFMLSIKFDIIVILFLGLPILISYILSQKIDWLAPSAILISGILTEIFLCLWGIGILVRYNYFEKETKDK